MLDAQRAAAVLLPHRIRPRHLLGRAGCRHPAEFRIIGVRRARRREQHDRRRMGIDGFAVLLKRQIVDARAFEVDAAAKPRRVDRNMRRGRDHRLAAQGRRLLCDGRGRARHRRRAGLRRRRSGLRRARLRRAGLHLRLLLLLEPRFFALLLHLRVADEILPADHDEQRQHDGEDGVLVLDHAKLVRRLSGWVLGRLRGRFWRLLSIAELRRPGRRTRFM